MAREALLQMNCSRFSEKIIDIIDLLFKIGWKYFSNDGMVEYLPIGDIDDYNWEKMLFQMKFLWKQESLIK